MPGIICSICARCSGGSFASCSFICAIASSIFLASCSSVALSTSDVALVRIVDDVQRAALDQRDAALRVDETAAAVLHVHLLREFRLAGFGVVIDQLDVNAGARRLCAERPRTTIRVRFMKPLMVCARDSTPHVIDLKPHGRAPQTSPGTRGSGRNAHPAAPAAALVRLPAVAQRIARGQARVSHVPHAAAPQGGSRRCAHRRAGGTRHAALRSGQIHRLALGTRRARAWCCCTAGEVTRRVSPISSRRCARPDFP